MSDVNMASLSSTGLTVIGSLVVAHGLFMLRYPDSFLFGLCGLGLVVAFYIYKANKKSSVSSDKKNVKVNF